MNNYYKILITISMLLFLGACSVSFDPIEIIKNNPQVDSFMKEYPDAEVLVTYFNENESIQLLEEIKETCNKEVSQKAMYRFYVRDQKSDLEIVGYIDAVVQRVECLKKHASEEEGVEKGPEDNQRGEFKDGEHRPSAPPEYPDREHPRGHMITLHGKMYDEEVVHLEWKIHELEGIEKFEVVYNSGEEDFEDTLSYFEVEEGVNHYDEEVIVSEVSGGTLYILAHSSDGEIIGKSNPFHIRHNPEEHHKDDYREEEWEQAPEHHEGELWMNAYYEDGYINVEWEMPTTQDIKYMKIVYSEDERHPKYPEDSTLMVLDRDEVEDYSESRGDDEFEGHLKLENEKGWEDEEIFFAISVVLDNDEVIHSNSVPVHFHNQDDHYEDDHYSDEYSIEIDLEEREDEGISVEVEFEGNLENIKYVKLLMSEDNMHPEYGEDEMLSYQEYPDEHYTEFRVDWFDSEYAYFRALLVLENGEEIYSNTEKNYREDHDDDLDEEVENSGDDENEDDEDDDDSDEESDDDDQINQTS